jgi:hypothetical protein
MASSFKKNILVFLSLLLFCLSFFRYDYVFTVMSGGTYEIYADVFSFVEDSLSTGTFAGDYYLLTDTGGESFASFATGTSGIVGFTLRSGFQSLEMDSIDFSVSAGSLSLPNSVYGSIVSSSVDVTVTSYAGGYSLYISDDGDLEQTISSVTYNIDDVSDGSVTAGSEEYGFRASGLYALITSDTALTTSLQNIAGTTSVVTNDVTEVIFSLSEGATTVPGTYSHTITLTALPSP